LIAHLLQPNSWHLVEHLGCSQIGSHTWLHTGESHFHWHLGWQSPFSPQSPVGESHAAYAVANIAKNTKAVFIFVVVYICFCCCFIVLIVLYI
jgi:hypothetical protein